MGTTTETDWFHYYLEPPPFGFYSPDTGSLEDLEKRLMLGNDPVFGFHDGELLPGFEINSQASRIVPVAPAGPAGTPAAPIAQVECSSSAFNAKSSGTRARLNPPPRMTRKLSVSEELNSLSLEHLSKQVGVSNPSPTTPPTTPHSHKRASTSPRSSPKKQQLQVQPVHPSPSLTDSKEGILGSLFGADDFSAMGLVFGGIGDIGSSRGSVMHRSLSSHALGQLPGSHSSALDSTIQGLQSCSGSIVSSLSQLLEVKEGDGLEIDVKTQSPPPPPPPAPPSGFSSSIRRVCSAGDIQRMNSLQPDGQDDGVFKIGRYSLAERKERIQRYRQKRSERNFNKKIKYACRKTLADSRPRVRGRFARNEDVVDSSYSALIQRQNKFKADVENEDEADVLLEDDESLLIDRQSSGELSECWGLPLDGR